MNLRRSPTHSPIHEEWMQKVKKFIREVRDI